MNRIYVYWCTILKDGKDNYGDILAPFLVHKLSGKKVKRVSHPMDRKYKWFVKHYVTVGSIINVVGRNSVVWGSGIIKSGQNIRNATFLAVRGPKTRERLLELGYSVPEIYGDPALLLPFFIKKTIKKQFEIGIIPHYVDYEDVLSQFRDDPNVKVINLITDDIIKTTKEILECKQIISSSLHGVIVSHAYQIPALWVKFSNKLSGDNIKFYDYLESLNLNYLKEFYLDLEVINIDVFRSLLNENQSILLPTKEILKKRQDGLLESCPFKKMRKGSNWKG